MSKTITEIFCFILLAVLYTYMMKKILDTDTKIFTKKNMILLCVLVLATTISYTSEYSKEAVVVRFLSYIIIFKLIFDESVYKILVLCIMIMLISLLGDLLNTSIIMNFLTLEEIRTNPLAMIISNILANLYTFIIFNIKPILNKLKLISKNMNDSNILSLIIICASIFLLTICVAYNVADIYEFSISYFINVIIIVTFITVLVVFFIDNNKYQNLLKEYDSLFEYIQTFEDSIDKINLSNHEFKNELVVLRSYINESKKKKALNIIDEIIVENKKQDSNILNSIKNIPKGGIKGLFYYKIIVATNKKLNINLDISKTIKPKIKRLDLDQLKLVCNLIGIYLDNAIEAAEESKKKLIGIELYTIDDKLNFVVSNTFKSEKIDLEKLSRNGYTTKGKNHGRGLYLAKKLISKVDWIKPDTKIVNNMYVQKIMIDVEKINQNKTTSHKKK